MPTSYPARIRGPFAVLLVSAALVAASCTQQDSPLPELGEVAQTVKGGGEHAPDFSVVTFDGPTFSM